MILFIIQCSLGLRALGHIFMQISPHVPLPAAVNNDGDERVKALVPKSGKY